MRDPESRPWVAEAGPRRPDGPVRVMVADDQALFRDALRALLVTEVTLQLAGQVGDGVSLLTLADRVDWDVLLLELFLPDRCGLDLLGLLRRRYPRRRVLVLTRGCEAEYGVRALRAGADGFLDKHAEASELFAAIHTLACGGNHVGPALARQLSAALADPRAPDAATHEALSDREFQVLVLLARGCTSTEVGERLCLSIKTVSTYRTRLLGKLGLSTTAQLIRYAFEQRLLPTLATGD